MYTGRTRRRPFSKGADTRNIFSAPCKQRYCAGKDTDEIARATPLLCNMYRTKNCQCEMRKKNIVLVVHFVQCCSAIIYLSLLYKLQKVELWQFLLSYFVLDYFSHTPPYRFAHSAGWNATLKAKSQAISQTNDHNNSLYPEEYFFLLFTHSMIFNIFTKM